MPQTFAVIMAGGVGARFWPRSRERSPKQFLEILGGGTMIENTLSRLKPLVDQSNVFVVTNRIQADIVRQLVPEMPSSNVLAEPIGRNTAACVGLSALWINRVDPDALMVVLPADHIVLNTEEFLRILQLALRVAQEKDALVTIGIKPTHPETGYGYIQSAEEEIDRNEYRSQGVYRVKTFAEKPNLETAERFLESGDFLWNSGIFVWKASVILRELEIHLPELHEQLLDVRASIGTPVYEQTLEHAYRIIRSISIDYGIMEKAGNVYVVKGDFGWSDVGSWDEVVRLTPTDDAGNSIRGRTILVDSNNNYVDAGKKIVATIGVDDLIIISTDDALLVCKKERSQEVKEVVDFIRRKQMNEYL
ncbi:MAG: mannose-1-phosphate guanylyltransferase [Ignavibacteria bacterium]|nr:mannose-1-phosphate guanylyltransferase [Ignavibacteria bacterium]